ncbi:universal stress protein [Halobacteriales archaeon QS_8_69_26]|nr:MAG: universal stress protein [Halobacteriales archaeon QS_8_69_26]
MTESLRDDRAPGSPSDLETADDHRDTVLVPVGLSDDHRVETLADTAAEVAGMMQASVRVLHVFTPERYERTVESLYRDPDCRPPADEMVRRVDPVRELTAELAPALRSWGMTMDVEGRVGESVSDEVVAAARAADAKRIIVGGRRRTPVGKAVFGSTVQDVLLDAPCPVTFVQDGPGY